MHKNLNLSLRVENLFHLQRKKQTHNKITANESTDKKRAVT